jgi:hypothetical protein
MVKIYYNQEIHSEKRTNKLWTVRKLKNRKQRRNSFLKIKNNYQRFQEYPYGDCGGIDCKFIWKKNCLKRCDLCRAI